MSNKPTPTINIFFLVTSYDRNKEKGTYRKGHFNGIFISPEATLFETHLQYMENPSMALTRAAKEQLNLDIEADFCHLQSKSNWDVNEKNQIVLYADIKITEEQLDNIKEQNPSLIFIENFLDNKEISNQEHNEFKDSIIQHGIDYNGLSPAYLKKFKKEIDQFVKSKNIQGKLYFMPAMGPEELTLTAKDLLIKEPDTNCYLVYKFPDGSGFSALYEFQNELKAIFKCEFRCVSLNAIHEELHEYLTPIGDL